MNAIIKPGIALFIITAVTAIILGAVQAVTAEPIRIQEEITRQAAMRIVLPDAEEFKDDVPLPGGESSIESAYTGYAVDGTVVGYVIGAQNKGYGGSVHILVSVLDGGTVGKIQVVDSKETPGLGANASKAQFTDQFTGLTEGIKVVKLPPNGNEIQAITSSTITSNAVTLSVNDALSFYNQTIKGAQQ